MSRKRPYISTERRREARLTRSIQKSKLAIMKSRIEAMRQAQP